MQRLYYSHGGGYPPSPGIVTEAIGERGMIVCELHDAVIVKNVAKGPSPLRSWRFPEPREVADDRPTSPDLPDGYGPARIGAARTTVPSLEGAAS